MSADAARPRPEGTTRPKITRGEDVPPRPQLQRMTFATSRLLEFCTQKELVTQTGQPVVSWPLVIVKELIDNALDAAEEAGVPPQIWVAVRDGTITVTDNGPGIPASTVEALLDFSVRVSSREAYVSPTRGAQGNAMKTLVAMPYVLDGRQGSVEIAAHGVAHTITFNVDAIRQMPVIAHARRSSSVKIGTRVTVNWPSSASSKLNQARERFLQLADDFIWLNHCRFSKLTTGRGRSILTDLLQFESARH